MGRTFARLVSGVGICLVLGSMMPGVRAAPASAGPAVPRFSHVMELFLENEDAASTWEDAVGAPHLAALKAANTYIPNFYAVGHASLDNYQAAFGAVEPTTTGKADCAGQPYGSCIFAASVPTIARLLDDAGLSWKVYSEGEEGAPGGGPCLHSPSRNTADPYQGPGMNGYATRHNPAPWFDSIMTKGGSEDYCRQHAVDLTHLDADLQSPSTLPTFSFIEPDTCHDGHDTQSLGGCTADPEGPAAPSGVAAMDAWLPGFVAKVTTSPAWDADSVLFLTLDEGPATDTAGCQPCHDASAGGRTGAVVISGRAKPGVSTWPGDHYGFVRTIEAAYGLPTLAATAAGKLPAGVVVHDADPGVVPLTDVWKAPSFTAAAAGDTAVAGATTGRVAGRASLPATGSPAPWMGGTGVGLAAAGLALRRRMAPPRPSSDRSN